LPLTDDRVYDFLARPGSGLRLLPLSGMILVFAPVAGKLPTGLAPAGS